jgi:hypothetical protein
LVEGKVISESEARLGLASPKLTMLCKIGEYADRLRHHEIVRYFLQTGSYGYTNLFQFAVLFDQTPADQEDEARIQLLVDKLRHNQVTSRQGLLRLTREMKQATRDTASDLVGAFRDNVATQIGQGFDLLLSAPPGLAVRKLHEDYADWLPRCLRIGELMASDAVLVVVVSVSDLPVTVNKLLPGCGFEGIPPRVFLIRSPVDPEVTGEQVVIVAERGSVEQARLSNIRWLPHDEPIDPFALAGRLVPDAKKKLNLFASAQTDGWCSIIGEANWNLDD